MPEVIAVAAAGALTALATGLGAIPVFLLGQRAESLRPLLWGFAAGVMAVASIAGLLMPALDEGGAADVALGTLAGVAFLVAGRVALDHDPRTVARSADSRRAILVFGVLLVHSLPEGFAVGTAWASSVDGLALFIVLAIALQNIPEGTVVAIPMDADGASRGRQFWAAVLSSAPQPFGAVVAFLAVEQVSALLAVSFAFAGGAMLALVISELLPAALAPRDRRSGLGGLAVGTGLMLIAVWTIGV